MQPISSGSSKSIPFRIFMVKFSLHVFRCGGKSERDQNEFVKQEQTENENIKVKTAETSNSTCSS